MAIGEKKTVAQSQSLWCYPGKHTIPRGGEYVIRADGSQSCWECREIPCSEVLWLAEPPLIETRLAGAHS